MVTMMNNKLLAVLCALLLTGCSSITTQMEEPVKSEEPAAESPEENSGIKALVENSADKSLHANGYEITLSDKEWTELLTLFGNLQTGEPILPKETGTREDTLLISVNGASHKVCRVVGDYCSYIDIDGRADYAVTAEAEDMFERYCGKKPPDVTGESKPESPEDRLVGLSVQCEEPTNPDEYLNTARKIVAQWLDSLKNEDERYRLPSYTFTDSLNENRVFHGDGYINGGREFVCYVAFDTPIEDEKTAFYAVGTYDTFYHYYFGPGVLARFRWENGVCTLTDYDEAFAMLTSDRLKSGLYGISGDETDYATFYDFLNDNENVENWLSKEERYGVLCPYVVSHNVMMLANGKVVFVDIGNNEMPEYNGDYATTDMCQSFYDSGGESLCGSPVDFIDGKGAVVMTYRIGFPLVFDDYNHDGNPDYAIRISSDENGSVYDVRCMDINGTPWEDSEEVYIYGEFAESIRLQVSDRGMIMKPVADGNGMVRYEETALFADKSNTTHHDVSDDELNDYRMYSQKFYLPDKLRSYDSTDKRVICYFWNNTDKKVTAGGKYEIERLTGDVWETVSSSKKLTPVEVKAGECAELSFDISDIPDGDAAVYRIKLTVNGKAVYGGFYMGNGEGTVLEISSREYPAGVRNIGFDIANTGLNAAYPEAIALYRGNKRICEVDVGRVGAINSGETETVTVLGKEVEGGFTAGEYRLMVLNGGKEYSGSVCVKDVPRERLYYFPETVPAEKNSGGLKLTLKNNIWSEENASVEGISVEVQKDGIWYDTVYEGDSFDEIVIPYGGVSHISVKDHSDVLDELKGWFDDFISGKYDEYFEGEDLSEYKNMPFDEYIRDSLNIAAVENGDLCRAAVCLYSGKQEYVYFYMP